MNSQIKKLRLKQLGIDSSVQRTLNIRRAKRMSEAFDWDAFGVLTVSGRGDATYVILDGQHRVAAARLAGFENESVSCEVFSGLDLTDEARIFIERQNFKKPSPVDEYFVLLTKQDEAAMGIQNAIELHGWRVDRNGAEKVITAVRALEELWRRDPRGVDRTIGVLTGAWGHGRDVVAAGLISGAGQILTSYGDQIDDKRLIDKLSKNFTAESIYGAARTRRASTGGTVANAMANVIKDLYNRGLTANRRLL